MIHVENVTILGPSPEAIEALRRDFDASAAEWRLRAEQAGCNGDAGKAATYLGIADLAARVASGGGR